MLELKDISISRGEREIVRNASVSAGAGEVTALIGRNGAGKTTLLNCIAGLIEKDSGFVFLNGRDFSLPSEEWRKKFSYSIDSGGIIPVLTVEEQLMLACYLIGLKREDGRLRIEHILNTFKLKKYRNYFGEELSAGLTKRLSMALTLLKDTGIYMYDEPFNALDVEGIFIFKRIIDFLKGKGKIVIIASHTFPLSKDLFSRIWYISDGFMENIVDPERKKEYLGYSYSADGDNDETNFPWIE